MTLPHAKNRARCGREAASLVALVLLTACTHQVDAGDESPSATATKGVRVLQPGAPGEPARQIENPGPVDVDDSWNHADVAFMQMMIPHHGQALEIARLAERRAGNARVRTLAERIRAAQGPEIMAMAAWLEEHDIDVPRADEDPHSYDHSRHGHHAMTGMLSDTEMRQLARSRGKRFDRLFLTGMIKHHRGALEMVEDVAPAGVDLRVSELAADVAATQAAEIARMEDVLRSL